MTDQELAKMTIKNPFYVDKDQPGIVRGGWLDSLGGFLIGPPAAYVANALNNKAESMQ